MNIGILTFHHTTNYGATLQAYALYKFIEEQGHTVEFINYQPQKAVRVYNETLYLKARKKDVPSNFIRDVNMKCFVNTKMKVGKQIYSNPEELKRAKFHYDAVIVGSDEVWNINSFRGCDTSYFLDFLDSRTKKISYAASFGSTTDLKDKSDLISNFISGFDSILVRDTNSLKIVADECGSEAKKVLDPTFLIDFKSIVKEKPKKNHILVYGKIPDSLASSAKDFASKLGLPIISIGYRNGIADTNFLGASPEDWVSHFSASSYVFTSFFHGTIFSILFKKPFTVFSAEQKKNKLSDLLIDFNLHGRIHSIAQKNNIDFSDIDYHNVFEKIEEKRISSKKFLLDSLNYGN